jgi:hypothetical protein
MAARSIRDTMRPPVQRTMAPIVAQPVRTPVTPAPMLTPQRPLGQTGVPIFNPAGPQPMTQMQGQPVQIPMRQPAGPQAPMPAAPVATAAAPPMTGIAPRPGLQIGRV